MSEHETIIFNLFIIELWSDYFFKKCKRPTVNQHLYDLLINTSFFKILKDCFPENEVCDQEVFHCGDKCYYKTTNWIAKDIKED